MRVATCWAALLAAFLSAVTTAGATSTPAPAPTRMTVRLPSVPLHSEVVVEVNSKGQVVRVKSTKPSKLQSFNVQTYGNALQMWIRRCHDASGKTVCTAQVGLYRVTYDYDPKTGNVLRRISLVSAGGNWGNQPGAANVMIEMARKQAATAEQEARKAQAQQNAKLPSLNEIRGIATPKPTHAPTLPP